MMYRSCAFAILVILGLSANVALAGKFVGLEVGTRYVRSHWLYPTEICFMISNSSMSLFRNGFCYDVTNFDTDTGPN